MRKILILADGLIKKEQLDEPAILKRFEKYGADVTVKTATDTTGIRYNPEQPIEWVSKIEKEGPEWVEPDEEIMRELADTEILLTQFSGVNEKMMDAAKNLKMIGVMRSGVENVNMAAARARGIQVCSCPGRVSEPVADFAVLMMLAESRNIMRDSISATGKWTTFNKDPMNVAMKNLTVGLVGFGVIGSKVASRLAPFGSRVLAYDPYTSQELASKYNVTLVTLPELLKEADIVSVHARLCPETKDLIGAEQFALMKPNAIFINTARAGLVNEQALIDALTNKTIRSAAIDVFWNEPLAEDHPLMKLDNVTLTAHRAGGTVDVLPNSIDIMLEDLDNYFAGAPLKHLMK